MFPCIKSLQLIRKLTRPIKICHVSSTLSRGLDEIIFEREHIPDESIFILDGTSLIYSSFFSDVNDLYLEASLTPKQSKILYQNYNYTIEGDESIPCPNLVSLAARFVNLISSTRPRYLAVIFDAGRKTFRNDLYPGYKSQRPARPPEMDLLHILAPRVLEIMGCKCIKQLNFEADDVMATLATWARTRGLNVVLVSSDKDMLQLVGPGVHVLNPKSREYLCERKVQRKYGVPPSRLCDYFALMGDSADNIPGVPGVGPKKARALVEHFGSVEQLQLALRLPQGVDGPAEEEAAADSESLTLLKEALRGVQGSPSALLSSLRVAGPSLNLFKRLVTLRRDVPVTSPAGLGFERCITFSRRSSGESGMESVDTASVVVDTLEECLEELHLDTLDSQHFRYTGETQGAYEALAEISPSLSHPLYLLRYLYHKLDRE